MFNPVLPAPVRPAPESGPPTQHTGAAETSNVKEERSNASELSLATISVSSKLPEFWVDMPRLWFAQFEAVMAPQKQGEEAKFNMVISKLGRDSIQQVSDLLVTPPESNKYTVLKERLLQVYEESAERQFQKLVSEMELGAQKPTQLLRHQTLKSLWLSRMPSSVRAVIAVCQDQSLESLATIADKVVENSTGYDVAAVADTRAQTTTAGSLSDLANQINQLVLEVASLRNEVYGRDRARSRSRGPARSRSNSRRRRTPADADWLCRFHYRFRRNARSCEQPCAWREDSAEN
ncbi:hypothetical protein ABMA28_003472 [Loxostege sticticalis]|uniref:DUF7041 domain-containing protein n=1 Tax=Loxostege sticticalis TaxID=481309 RepID=A0ABD0SW80_LOXSC